MGKGGRDNLVPLVAGTERAREVASAGGRAVHAAARRRRDMAELTATLLDSRLRPGMSRKLRGVAPELADEDATLAAQMVAGQINAAAAGNAQAFRAIMELDEAQRGRASEASAPFVADFGLLVGPRFLVAHRAVTAGLVTDLWLDGGRGSLKSSYASLELVNVLERDPDANALVMQRVGADIRNGSFAQVMWALEALGVSGHWTARRSARSIVNDRTGQLILFRGGDDARKTKGVKFGHGYCGVLWLEEADQFPGMADVRTIRQSVTRGGHVLRMYTFNPPRSKDSWANVEADRVAASPDPSEMRESSTYLDAPPEWLGEQFLEDAEGLREADEEAYRHEYLGEAVGVGGAVFTRAAFEEVADQTIATFDRLHAGQDWGWWPDPWAFVLSAWEPSTRTLYSFREAGGNRLQPPDSAEMVRAALTWPEETPEGRREPAYHPLPVLSDDADPGSIRAHRDAGVNARAAGKGGNRMRSYEWLAGVRWVIDPVRCPRLAKEVRAMTYDRAADGTWLSSIPDGDDHWVDAVRYSVMPIVTRAGAYGTDKQRKTR
jgi:phage terminase large subunit